MEIKIKEATETEAEQVTELVVQFREEHSRLVGGEKMVELRKNLTDQPPDPRDASHVLGYRWEIL